MVTGFAIKLMVELFSNSRGHLSRIYQLIIKANPALFEGNWDELASLIIW